MKVDLHAINHVLIPKTREERDRWRRGRAARAAARAARLYHRFTPEGRALLAFTLFASLFVFDARRGESHVFFAALVGLFVASFVVGRALALGRVTVRIASPERVTVGEEASFVLTVESRREDTVDSLVCVGPFLTWGARWSRRRASIALLEPGRPTRVVLRARFVERGETSVGTFRVARLAPARLVTGPAIEASGARLLVVPRVANVVEMPLPRARRHQPGGVALASSTGESRDLAGVRPYRPGDPVRDLHARTWARTGYPVVREYQQEYFTRIGVVVDLDAPLGAGDPLEAVLEVAAGIVARVSRGDDLVDLLAIGDEVHALTLGRSLGSLPQALDLLACAERAPEPLDPERLLQRVGPHLPRLSALVVVGARWSAAHASFVDRVEAAGVAVRGVVVGGEDVEDGSSRVRRVGLDEVRRGEALFL